MVSQLNPHEVRQAAEQRLRIGLWSPDEAGYGAIECFLIPEQLTPARRAQAARRLFRAADAGTGPYDLDIHIPGTLAPDSSFPFDTERLPGAAVAARPDLALALARQFEPFRGAYTRRAIHEAARDNALFALATALPGVAPFLGLGTAVAEFAGDTAVLTANQVRLAFLLAAANDRPAGFGEQRGEIAGIVAGAFGWRAVARELAGKVPFGGGLLPKAAIAYAGTYAAGLSLDRFYRLGYAYTRAERRAAFDESYERGKAVAKAVIGRFTSASSTSGLHSERTGDSHPPLSGRESR